jgi:glutamate:GABA antiporter
MILLSSGEEIREPQRVIPRALFVSGSIFAIGYIAGTCSLLVALPAGSISGLSGFMAAIDLLARHTGLPQMVAPVAVLVAISSIRDAGFV